MHFDKLWDPFLYIKNMYHLKMVRNFPEGAAQRDY